MTWHAEEALDLRAFAVVATEATAAAIGSDNWFGLDARVNAALKTALMSRSGCSMPLTYLDGFRTGPPTPC